MFEKVKEIIVEELGKSPDEITMDTDLRNDLGLTSIEMIEAVMVCEETFNIEMDETVLASINTIGELAKYIEELKG